MTTSAAHPTTPASPPGACRRRAGVPGLTLAATTAAALWLAAVLAIELIRPLLPQNTLPPTCLFRAATGIPCPTCGATRAVVALSHGHIASGAAYNPLLFSAGLAAAFLAIARAATGVWPRRPTWATTSVVWLGSAALVMANWVYLLLTDRPG